MKKYVVTLTILLACTFLASCGDKAEQESPWIGIAPGADLTAVTERTEYFDLTVETEELFNLGLWEKNPEKYYQSDIKNHGIIVYSLLGMQFVMGEPAQLWSEVSSDGVNIYLYRTDGDRELLLQEFADMGGAFADARFQGYVDQDKNCYFYRTDLSWVDGEYIKTGIVMKVNPTGEIQYQHTLEPGFQIEGIRQTEDGRLYVLLNDSGSRKEVLQELDPNIGEAIQEFRMEWDYIGGWPSYLGAAGAFPARASLQGIDSIDIAAQSISPRLYADGTSYALRSDWEIQDFQVQEDGTIEFLWADQWGHHYTLDRMRMEKVEKVPIVLRGIFVQEVWLSEKVALFNQKSNEYHVIMETCGSGDDLEDYARLTSVQIGAGKGPDILCGTDLLKDYIGGMLEKRALEMLNPYIEASGIREEDYFPLVFSMWRQGEGIYSVTPRMSVFCEEMDAEILGSGETPDIETLADALLAQEESAVYRKDLTSEQVLKSFLQGSENLWGMVDWENGGKNSSGSCNFNTPLFEKLLEAARRYGDDGRRGLEPEITYYQCLLFFFTDFNTSEEQAKKGRVYVGTLFDDGCHAVSNSWYTMAINANSSNKEGAWEFIAFLLGEEVQYREEADMPPVHRESFDKWLEWEISQFSEVHYENGNQLFPIYYGADTSQEKREAYKKAIEDARPLSMRTAPILTIILEEAEDYFNGSKSAEEVSRIINNRVQLYLNEMS